MKKWISVLLTLSLCLSLLSGCVSEPTVAPTDHLPATTNPPVPTTPGVDYANSTVILYTANVRGDVSVYSTITAVRDRYRSMGATVYLVDAGNYLQGSAYTAYDMGLTIYHLMSASGYQVAGMGLYEFVNGDAASGYRDHGDYTLGYTQAELYRGTPKMTYQQNAVWEKTPVYATRPGTDAAQFQVVCSNLKMEEENSGYYAFEPSVVLGTELKVGFVSTFAQEDAKLLREENLQGYTFTDVVVPVCDVLVALGGGEGDIVISAPTDGEMTAGAYIINKKTGEIAFEAVDMSVKHPQMEAILAKLPTADILGVSNKIFNGSAASNGNAQTDLGALVADALKWYAENQMQGIEYPVVGLFSGGNCRDFLYSGVVTMADLCNALHVSTNGVGVVYMTGAQILEMLEAATQRPDCPAWAQISGLEYTVNVNKAYDFGAAYGLYYKANSVNRVSVTTEGFDVNATYAVISDMLILSGEDTYYICKELPIVAFGETEMDTCDILAMYIQQALDGKIS